MKKSDLVKLLAEEHGISAALANRILRSVVGHVQQSVAKRQRIALPGLGSFTTVSRPGRDVITPGGVRLEVPAHMAVRFSPSKELRESARNSRRSAAKK